VTGALRFDDNSSFGEDSKLLVYPKAQVSWIASEEPFWNLDFVDEFRFRSAYGKSGRAPDALAATTFVTQFVGVGNTSSLLYSAAGNPAVQAEESSELEVGVDFSVLDQRVSGEFTWFHQWVRQAIVGQSTPSSQGIKGTLQSNLGAINNWGWEAVVDVTVYRSPSFSFDLHLSADHTDNVITKLNEEQQNDNFVEGYYYPNVASIVIDSVTMYDCGGPCSTVTDPITAVDPYDNTIGWQGWCDIGDPNSPYKEATSPSGLYPGGPSVLCSEALAANQELMIGRGFAPYSWTMAPSLRFLNNTLELTALIQGQYGRWYDDGDAASRTNNGTLGGLQANSQAAQVMTDPYWLVGQIVNDDRYQGRFDASFWRLREISARYQLPADLVSSVGADRASVAVSARNLWFLWRRQAEDLGGSHISDPENVGALSQSPNIGLQQVPAISSFAVTFRVAF
jgi:hypothetical protein